jgi:DNA-binding CsgD family transcriptional regulator/PAS domain-containing protein
MMMALFSGEPMRTVSFEDYSRLVTLIYSSGFDERRWSVFLAALSGVVGHACFALHSHDMDQNSNIGFLSHNYSDEHHSSYRAHYAELNPWNEQVARMEVGRAIPSQAVLPAELLKRTEFYNDWIRPQEDIGTGAGITLFKDSRRFLRLSANIRFRDLDAMQPRLLSLLNALGPHLSAAFDMTRKLAVSWSGQQYQDALERAQTALFLLDGRGRIRLINRLAERLASEGNYLTIQSGSLVFRDPSTAAAVDAAIGCLTGALTAPPAIPARGPSGSPTLEVTLTPFAHHKSEEGSPFGVYLDDLPQVVLAVAEPTRSDTDAIRLARQFGLTSSEVALAVHLLGGGTVRSFSDTRRVTINTARNQVRSLMAKTDSSKQGVLVARLAQALRPGLG